MGVEKLELIEQSPSAETNSQAVLRFITMFTTARLVFLYESTWMQSIHILFL
jgi:hypothetical protein